MEVWCDYSGVPGLKRGEQQQQQPSPCLYLQWIMSLSVASALQNIFSHVWIILSSIIKKVLLSISAKKNRKNLCPKAQCIQYNTFTVHFGYIFDNQIEMLVSLSGGLEEEGWCVGQNTMLYLIISLRSLFSNTKAGIWIRKWDENTMRICQFL